VALLGSLPSEEFWQDLLSVVALSVAFAVTVWAGQRGYGPLKALLRGGMTAGNAAGGTAVNEVAAVAHTGVTVCCEWILAVAWVGVLRHGADMLFDVAGAVGDDDDTASVAAAAAAAAARSQAAAWLTAFAAVLARGGFVVAFATHRHHRSKASGGESLLPGTTGRRGAGGGGRDDVEEVDREAGVTAAAPSSSSLMSSSMELSLRRVGSRAALHLLPGLQVARSARAMLLGAFAFTTGVALNAATQTSWRTMAESWGMGAVPPAVMYAAILSCITVAAASYGAMCGAEAVNLQLGGNTKEGEEDAAEEEEGYRGGALHVKNPVDPQLGSA
jgi:hypothetical protein